MRGGDSWGGHPGRHTARARGVLHIKTPVERIVVTNERKMAQTAIAVAFCAVLIQDWGYIRRPSSVLGCGNAREEQINSEKKRAFLHKK